MSTEIQEIKNRLAFAEIFRRFEPNNFKEKGLSHCPFHDDKTPSFEIKNGSGRCFAGCKPDNGKDIFDVISFYEKSQGCDFKQAINDLAQIAGITTVEQTKKSSSNRKKEAPTINIDQPTIIYDYCDACGDLRYQVLRYDLPDDKTFRPRRPDGKGGWIWNLDKVEKILYRLPEISRPENDVISFVEGEKDADRLSALGIQATTSAGGAQGLAKLHAGIFEPLRGKEIWIFPDNDPPGREYAKTAAGMMFGIAEIIRIIELPDLPEKGDISDFIDIHGASAKSKILGLGMTARVYFPDLRRPCSIIDMASLGLAQIDRPTMRINGLLPIGVSILAGRPKSGKSWLALQLLNSVATGQKVCEHFAINELAPGLGLFLEDDAAHFRERQRQLYDSWPGNIRVSFNWLPKDEGGFQALEAHIIESGSKLIVIDTWARFSPGKGDREPGYTQVYSQLTPLQDLALKEQAAILLIMHTRKTPSEDAHDSIMGSTGYVSIADSTLVLVKAPPGKEYDGILNVRGRRVEDSRHALSFNRGKWIYHGDLDALSETDDRDKIIEFLRENKKTKAKEIAEITGKSYDAARNQLMRLREKGILSYREGVFTLKGITN